MIHSRAWHTGLGPATPRDGLPLHTEVLDGYIS